MRHTTDGHHTEVKKDFTFAWRVLCMLLLTGACLMLPSVSQAQSPYTSIANGDWNSDATWSGTGIPGPGDIVQIRGGFTVTVNIPNAACASVKIGGDVANNNTGTLGFATTGNPTLTVTGNVQVGGDGNIVRKGTLIFQSGSTLTAGSVTIGGVGATPAPGVITMQFGGTMRTANLILGAGTATWAPGFGTVELTATNTIPGTIYTSFYNLIINGGTTTIDAAKSILPGGKLLLTSGTLAAGNFLSLTTTSLITRSEGNMTGTLQGLERYNVLYTGNSKTTGPELGVSGTNIQGLNNLTVSLTAGQTLTLDQNRNPDGDLTITSGIFDLSTFTINRTSSGGMISISNDAKLKIGGTNPAPSGYTSRLFGTTSTVEFYGGAQTLGAEAFGHLLVSAGTKATTGNITLAGNFTCNTGAVVNTMHNWTVTGQWTMNGTFSQTDGMTTFSSGATHEISGSGSSQFYRLATSQSTINANAHTISISENWSHGSSGVFNAMTSKVTFNGSGNQTQPAAAFVPSFYDLIINKTGGTLSSRVWTVLNEFQLPQGSFAPESTSSFKNVLMAGGTFSCPSGSITVSGNWTRNGGVFNPDSGTLIFNNAAADQLINGSATAQAFNHLTINKGSRKLILGGSISQVTVGGALAMTSGNIVLGTSGILELGTSVSTPGDLNYTSGTIINGTSGGFKRWVAAATTSPLDFPVGTNDNQYKARITFANNTGGSLTARYDAGDPGNNSGFPLTENGLTIYDEGQYTEGSWSLEASDLTSTNYALELTGTGFTSAGDEDGSVRIIKRPDSGGNWVLDGTHVLGTGETAIRSGMSGFSRFGHGRPCHNPATANAGPDQSICKGGSALLAGIIGGSASSATWTDGGAGGTFSPNNTTLNATYTPPVSFTGSITLTLTTNNPPGACKAVSDFMVLTVVIDPLTPTGTKSPNVINVCAGQILSLTGVTDNGGGAGTCNIEYRYSNGASFTVWSTTPASFPAVTGINKIEIRKNCSGSGCDLSDVSVYSWNVVNDPAAPTAVKSPNVNNVCVGMVLTLTDVTDNGGGTGSCRIEYRYNQGAGFTEWSITPVSLTAIAGINTIEIRKNCNGSGCDISQVSSYSWTVVTDPVAADPTGVTICSGTSAVLSVSPSGGTGTFNYQWQQMSPNCTSPVDVGTNSATFTTAPLATGIYFYRCVITQTGNGCNPIITGCAVVTVNPSPSCAVSGPLTSCPVATGLVYTAPAGMVGYAWSVTGNGSISGPTTGQTVSVNAGALCNASLTVSLTVTDANGCTSVCTRTTQVVDLTPPEIICPWEFFYRGSGVEDCSYTTVGSEFDPYAMSDNCSIAQVINDYNNTASLDGSAFPVGSTLVNWTILDYCGHSATCAYTIVIEDDQAPVLTCPVPANPYNVGEGTCSRVLSFVAPSADNCGMETTVYSVYGSPITFPYDFQPGSTPVDVVSTDINGNSSMCSFTVVVEDHEYPVVTCPPVLSQYPTDAGACFASLSFTEVSSDNCGLAGTSFSINDDPISFPYAFNLGPTTVDVFVYDLYNNVSNCSFLVDVADLEGPVISCPTPANPYIAEFGGCELSLSFVAESTDNCGVAGTVYKIGGEEITFPYVFEVGATIVEVVVTDIHDNVSTCAFTVLVEDGEAPLVSCPVPANPYIAEEGLCSKSLSFTATSSDICGLATTEFLVDGNNITFPYDFPAGTTIVVVMATDLNGNTATCSFDIVVLDTQLPSVNCPVPSNPYTTDPGQCNRTMSFEVNSADNCMITETVYSVNGDAISFPYDFEVGTTTVAVAVTDIQGNSSACSFTVVVEDTEAPVVTCPLVLNPYPTNIGACSATLSFAASVTDNCAVASTVYTINGNPISFPYNFTVGSTGVQVLVTDIHGNASECFFFVTVIDTEAPALTCPLPANPYSADKDECSKPLSFAATYSDNCGVAGVVYSIDGDPISFPYSFPVGSTTVAVQVTDIHGNMSSCTFPVIIEDDEQPIITCPVPGVEYATDAGQCHTSLYFAATATDNCGLAGTTYSIDEVAITFPYDFPVGTTTVVAEATDIHGNASSCAFVVTVADNEHPLITCPAITGPYPTDPGQCVAMMSFEATASDNCGVAGIVYNVSGNAVSFPYGFPIGATTVMVVVTDINNNTSSCAFTVIVEDTEYPVVTCPILTNPYATDPGECQATLNLEATTSDNCGIASMVYSVDGNAITFPYDFSVGSTAVDVLVTDIHGHASTCSFTVEVMDDEAPLVTCPLTDQPYATDEGDCNATLSLLATATDNCGVASIIYSIGNSPITFPFNFPVGSTTVGVLVTDINGNTASCSYMVVVEDNQAPGLTCPPVSNPYSLDPGSCVALLSFIAESYDNCGIASTVYSINENEITFPYEFPMGTTTVYTVVTDIHGNTASCSFPIVVQDNEHPVLTCPDPAPAYTTDATECNATLSFEAMVTDNCGMAGVVYSIGSNPVDFPYDFPVGSTTVQVLATDIHGNTSSCAFMVVVEDEEFPVLTCPDPVNPHATDADQCYASLSYTATATDNCGVGDILYSIAAQPISFPYHFPVGSTTVEVMVTDINGNTSTCSFAVVVEDLEYPEVDCPTILYPYPVDAGTCTASLSFEAAAADNCGIASAVYSVDGDPVAFPFDFPVGATVVTAIVTDIHGNTSACAFTVEVVDDEAPVVTCPVPMNPYSTDAGVCHASLSFEAEATDNCGIASIVYTLGVSPGSAPVELTISVPAISFPYDFPVGSTIVDVLVTDINGNTSICEFTVVVVDDEQPVVTCPVPMTSYATDAGTCSTSLSFEATSSDNCAVAVTIYSVGGIPITFPYAFPVGTTTVDVLVTDVHDNSSACSFAIVVEDQENPLVTCPVPLTQYTTDPGECNASLGFEATAEDNCGVADIVYIIGDNPVDFPYDFTVGSTTVNVLVTDIHGNTASCSFVVTVADQEPPEVICPSLSNPYSTDPEECTAVLSLAATATDNCGVAGTTYWVNDDEIIFPYAFPVGSTTVVAVVTDIHGNVSDCSFTVVVEDHQIPVIERPVPVASYDADAGECHATLSFAALAFDNCGVADIVYLIDDEEISFPYDFPVGTTTVAILVTDIHGNTSTSSFTVVVEDVEPPVVTCPVPANPYPTDAGVCSSALSFAATSADNCGIADAVYSINGNAISFPYSFPVGATVVDVVVTDIHGNTSGCSFSVTVQDMESPQVTCPVPANSYTTDPGECSRSLSFAGTSMDNCGIASMQYTVNGNAISFPYDFPVGLTTVNLMATDIHGNVASCAFVVNITDAEGPVVSCPVPLSSYSTDANECNRTLGFVATATDNCGVLSIAYLIGNNPVTFPYDFPVGSTAVNVKATDIHGNISICTFTVVVVDNQYPVVSCPIPLSSYPADQGECVATLSFSASASDNCGILSTMYSIGSSPITFPHDFPVGSTTVYVLVTDLNGNISICSFVVAVIDNQPPAVTCPAPSNPYTADAGECNRTLSFAATARDNCGVTSTVHRIGDNPITFPYDFPVGTTTVSVLVTDIQGNTATCSYTVIVNDNQPPVVTCPVPMNPYSTDAGECNRTLSLPASSSDNCGVDGTVYSVSGDPIEFPYDFPVGYTTVNSAVTDIHGNASSCTFTVVVTDNEPPLVMCPVTANPYQADAGQCATFLNLPAISTDNCGVASTTYSIGSDPISFPYSFPVGTTTVNVLVADIHGNTSTCSYNVVVEDTELPLITCPDPLNPYMTTPGECSRSLSFAADATDNCGVDIIAYTVNGNAISFPYSFPVGTTTVGVLVTDIHDNTSTCAFEVVIADTEQPSLTCPVLANPYTADAGECDASLSFSATATDNCGVAEIIYSVNSSPVDFPYDFPVGSTAVHVLVTDVNGNTNDCIFEVVVVDTQSPVITCPVPLSVYMTDAGQCSSTLSFEATATDNCGVAGTGYSVNEDQITFPYAFPVGSTIVVVDVTDIYGNVSTCSFTVLVEDVEIPMITCAADQTQVTDMGQCNADVDIPVPTTGDNCGVGTLINNYNGTGNASDNYPTGTTPVLWTVTDIHGNTSTCVQLITVVDDQAPFISCAPAQDQSADEGLCSALVTVTGPSAADNCGVSTLLNSFNGGTDASGSYPVGTTTIVWTATDAQGNTSTCTQLITVTDDEAPSLICAPGQEQGTDEGQCHAFVNVIPPAANDNCDIAAIVNSYNNTPDASGIYQLGTTIITWTVTDIHGNTNSCVQSVTIVDDDAPVITCAADQSQGTDDGTCSAVVTVSGPVVSDNCGEVTFLNSYNNTANASGNYPLGTTTVVWTATDSHGNTSTCIQHITITDDELPLITCAAGLTHLADPGLCNAVLIVTSPVASDNCGVATVLNSFNGTDNASGTYPVGTTIIVWTVTDAHGNTSTCTQSVIVIDDQAPVINCAMDQVQSADAGACSAYVMVNGPVAEDNCSVTSIVNNYNNESIASGIYPVGNTMIIWTVTDANGNTQTCSQVITVLDDEDPMIICPAQPVHGTDLGQCNAFVAVAAPVADDNCGVATLLNSYNGTGNASASYPVGTTTIIWTATDIHGNTMTCAQDIIVIDDEHPAIACPAALSHLADFGQCNADIVIGGPVAGDNCGVATILNNYNGTDDASDNYPVGTTTVVWTVTDIHGNTSTCLQVIIVTDEEEPMITCAADQMQGTDPELCTANVSVIGPVASDNCGLISVVNSYNGTQNASGNYPVGSTTVVWTATDMHGNSMSCTQIITVIDDEQPVIGCAPAQVQGTDPGLCSAAVTVTGPSFVDNCGIASVTNSFNNTSDASGIYPVGTTTITWTVTDMHGNTSVCTQTISITDDEPPVITCAADQDAPADEGQCQAYVTVTGPTADDNCTIATVLNSYTGTSDASGIYPVGSTAVVWTVTDIQGHTASCIQQITVSDDEAPEFTSPAQDQVVQCDGSGNSGALANWLASHGGATASDNCSDVTWNNNFTSISDGCGLTGTATVTFVAIDASGNMASSTASFTIIDNINPVLLSPAAEQTVECDGNGNENQLSLWLSTHGGAMASDPCSGVTWNHNFVGLTNDCGATGHALVTFTAKDECGNEVSTSATFTISDTQAPYWTNMPVNHSEECDGAGNTAGLNVWLNSFTAGDNCGSATVTHEIIGEVDGCGATGSLLVRFSATDACGNLITRTATFTVTDTQAPFWTNMPVNQTVQCDGNGNTAALNAWLNSFSAGDNCNSVVITNNYTGLSNLCGATGSAVVTFTATDECGNSIQQAATFTIADTTVPTWVNTPANLTVECDGNGNAAQLNAWLLSFTAADNCGSAAVTYNFAGFSVGCGETFASIVNFKATDECGNMTTKLATFTIVDTEDPYWINAPADLTIECSGNSYTAQVNAWLNSVTAGDQCGSASVTHNFTGLSDGCGATGSATVTFTATDECGNSSQAVATFSVVDTTHPLITSCPPDVTISCSSSTAPGVLGNMAAMDNCDPNVAIAYSDVSTMGLNSNECSYYTYMITRTFVATDACGNSSTCVQHIQVQDLQSPVLTAGTIADCYSSIALAEAAAIAATEGTDNCDGMLEYTASTSPPVNCEYQVTVTVSDACGNTSQQVYPVMIGCEVENTNDNGIGSLRAVIGCAQDGAEVLFSPNLAGQTIFLTSGEIIIDKDLTLTGLGMGNVSISGNNESRIFNLYPGHHFVVQHLTLQDGSAMTNGGALFVQGHLMLQEVMFKHNFENGVPKALSLSPGAIFEVNGNLELRY